MICRDLPGTKPSKLEGLVEKAEAEASRDDRDFYEAYQRVLELEVQAGGAILTGQS